MCGGSEICDQTDSEWKLGWVLYTDDDDRWIGRPRLGEDSCCALDASSFGFSFDRVSSTDFPFFQGFSTLTSSEVTRRVRDRLRLFILPAIAECARRPIVAA